MPLQLPVSRPSFCRSVLFGFILCRPHLILVAIFWNMFIELLAWNTVKVNTDILHLNFNNPYFNPSTRKIIAAVYQCVRYLSDVGIWGVNGIGADTHSWRWNLARWGGWDAARYVYSNNNILSLLSSSVYIRAIPSEMSWDNLSTF